MQHTTCACGDVYIHVCVCVCGCVRSCVCMCVCPFSLVLSMHVRNKIHLWTCLSRQWPFSSHLNKSMLHYTSLNKVGTRWFNPTINLDCIATLVSFPGSSPAWIEPGNEVSAAVNVAGVYNSSHSRQIFNLWNKESLWEHTGWYMSEEAISIQLQEPVLVS